MGEVWAGGVDGLIQGGSEHEKGGGESKPLELSSPSLPVIPKA